MALTSMGWMLSVTLRDSGFNTTTKEYQVRGTTHTAVQADATAIITALQAVTDGGVQSYRLTERYADVNFGGGAGEAEELAIVTGISSSARGVVLEIPAPKIGLFKNTTGVDKNIVDMTDTALQAYIALFASGGHAYVSDGESWVTSVDGQRGTKKSRQRKS